jgi:ElaB/YqjD/DUF883 family membrane-anchored ribosome-binding protein
MPTADKHKNGNYATGGAHRAAQLVKGLVDAGAGRASDLKDAALDRGRRAASRVEKRIEGRPFFSLGIAFMAGIALTLWMRRRARTP